MWVDRFRPSNFSSDPLGLTDAIRILYVYTVIRIAALLSPIPGVERGRPGRERDESWSMSNN
ncbi:hypothetical protein EMIT0194P_110043 [Pseudomonas serbica]